MKAEVVNNELTLTPETTDESALVGNLIARGIEITRVSAAFHRPQIGFGSRAEDHPIIVLSLRAKP